MSTSFAERLTHLRTYDEKAKEAAFLLGGIGTGNVSVGARGELRDWELFNRPGKGNKFPYTFFALHAECAGETYNRVLEGPIQPPFALSHGFDSAELAGLPRFQASRMKAEYPLCRVELQDTALPLTAALEAYTPFIPLDDEDSALPLAILRYRVKNEAAREMFVSVAGSLANMTTFTGYGEFNYVRYGGESRNRLIEGDGLRGILLESVDVPADDPLCASMALLTPNAHSTVKPHWYRGPWYDPAQDFWEDFAADGLLNEAEDAVVAGNNLLNLTKQHVGSVAPNAVLQPGEEATFTFYLTWCFPNRRLAWRQGGPKPENGQTVKNYYALRFADAFAVARYAHANLGRLEDQTLAFHEAFFSSTLPAEVLDAASANITVLRSTTCFRIEDGSFFGWEGCFDREGCCDGTCTHVWNYAQTLAFLFPSLEQSMRRDEFLRETEADGKMNFRSRKRLRDDAWTLYPAADGQTGSIARLYREWKLSGDDTLIDEMGENALKALDFSIAYWDADGDGVLDSQQHNTYDIEFYGPNSLTNSMFFCALKAGAAFARYLGQEERARDYERRFREGSARMDEMLWGGEYYVQKLEDIDQYPYQYATGCLSDQILGQFMAHVAGLGYVLPEEHARRAALSIYQNNFLRDFTDHVNVQRTFALGKEQGLLLCTWPKGGRPRFPFVYCDEVWTGIEYQVAATLLYEGCIDEGLELVRAVRARHDGVRRNPFNEVECGHHYARAMASWALVTALSGYSCDLTSGEVSFAPKICQDDFRCFFSNAKQWGVYWQKNGEKGVEILYEKA